MGVQIIHAIVGHVLTTRDSEDDPVLPTEVKEYTIHRKAEIIIDGRVKSKIAELELGDEVIVGNGSRDGFLFVEAKRLGREKTKAPVASDDLSKVRVLKLEEPLPKNPTVPENLSKLSDK